MYFLYSTLLTAGAILGSPYWIWKAVRERKYLRNFGQRIGRRLPPPVPGRPLWIHAVSVGEVRAARALFVALRRGRADLPIVVSTVTLTGQDLALREMPQADAVFYFPFDWHFAVRRFLDAVNPRAVVLLETEIWPNFLRCAHRRSIPVLLANGRISDKSLVRYRRIRGFLRRVFPHIRRIGAQTREDRNRFLQLGARDDQVLVTGNVKFDFSQGQVSDQPPLLNHIRSWMRIGTDTPVIVVGSTMRGEEALLLDVLRKVRTAVPEVRTILAPRHPERFDEVAELIGRSGIPFRRRTAAETPSPPVPELLLLDTIGELSAVYSLADVAIIGGSFLPWGGHNLLEAAAQGKAVIFGPEMSNFREMANLFVGARAALQCSADELPSALIELLGNTEARNSLGRSALETLRRNQGASQSTVDFLRPFLE